MGAIGDPLLHRVRGFVVSMSMDENTFLDAIIADPDDDAPRLIFADWLEETGDSDRAELIRIQCALARLEENDERRPGLREREGILMRERYDVWCQDRPSGWWNGRFRRGFLAEVDVNAESFLKCAGPLLRQMPVPYIRFFEARNFLAALAASPHLARLHGLCFPHSALSADDLEALVASPFLTNLQHLCLDGNPLGPSGARRLAASARLPRLIYLGLQGTHLGATGVEALAASRNLTGLEILTLTGNGIGGAGVEALAHADFPHLKTLYLGTNRLTPTGLRVLAHTRRLPQLVEIQLDNNELGTAGLEALAHSPLLARLEQLSLRHARVTATGLRALESAHLPLTCLDLSENKLPPRAFLELARCPLTALTRLTLEFNEMGDEGAEALAASPHLAGLRELFLNRTNLGPLGMKALVSSPNLSQLRTLDVGNNHIGDGGVQALAAFPHLANLTTLLLGTNGISDLSMAALVRSPHLFRLRNLDLSENDLTDAGALILAEAPFCRA